MPALDESFADITILQDASALSTDDLLEEYDKIASAYTKARQIHDAYRQKVYQLECEQKLSAIREDEFRDEINIIGDTHADEMANATKQSQTKIGELRTRIDELKALNEQLESENAELKKRAVDVAATPVAEPKPCNPNETIVDASRFDALIELESKYFDVVEEIAAMKAKVSELTASARLGESKMSDLSERLECAQENLNSKSNELQEIQQISETQQERIFELETELANFRTGTVDHGKKGNSLFAEVDDQRQAMRHDMKSMREKYLFMKRKFTESETEIRRLRRENADIHGEIRQCINMFSAAETADKHRMADHIGMLTRENKRLQARLQITETKLYESARKHDAVWLQSMWEHNKRECEELQKEHFSSSVRKSQAEHCYAESQKTAARWRFEALKNRCVIIDRELLLETNKIPYDAQMKSARRVVEQRYGDGSNEQPEIDVEVVAVERNISLVEIADTVNMTEMIRSAAQDAQAPQTLHAADDQSTSGPSASTSADTSVASSESSTFEASAFNDSAMRYPVELSIMLDESEMERLPGLFRVAPRPNPTTGDANVATMDGEFRRPTALNGTADASMNNVCAVKQEFEPDSTSVGPPDESLVAATDFTIIKTEPNLADELAAIQPQYRKIQRSTERSRALREISENITDTSMSADAKATRPATDDAKVAGTQYRIVPQRRIKSKIIIRPNNFTNHYDADGNLIPPAE